MNQKLAIGIVGLVIIAGGIGIYSSNNSKSQMMEKEAVMQKEGDTAMMAEEGFQLMSGKMVMVNEKTKAVSMMEKDVTLSNGTMVMMSGKVVKKDGTTIMLKEGESVWMDGSMTKAGEMMNKQGESAMMTKAGSYESFDASKIAMASSSHKVVLFFRASWCPTCIAVDKDIKANLKTIPENLTILDVNYDNSTELKKKYGVTYQHTFVQVDAQGNLIKKWSGSPALVSLVSEVK